MLAQQLYSRIATLGHPVHPNVLPSGADLPALTYQRVGMAGQADTHEPGRATLTQTRWQVTVWAERYHDLQTVAEQALRLLDGWQDHSASPRIDRAALVMDNETIDPDTQRHRRILDVLIWAAEGNEAIA